MNFVRRLKGIPLDMVLNKIINLFEHQFMKYRKYLVHLSKKRSRQSLYEFLEKQYSMIREEADVLTVGSGGDINKLLMSHATVSKFHVLSLDIDSNREPDIVGDICKTDFGEGRFDAVVLCEVLEHLKHPDQGLANIHKMLKPGGTLILSTPFIFPVHDRPHDYFRFTRYGLELLLESFGDVVITERNSYFEAIDVLWMRLLFENNRREVVISIVLVPVIFFLIRPITKLLTRLIKSDSVTTGYVVTATKQYLNK